MRQNIDDDDEIVDYAAGDWAPLIVETFDKAGRLL